MLPAESPMSIVIDMQKALFFNPENGERLD
jgi:hypothetical protein